MRFTVDKPFTRQLRGKRKLRSIKLKKCVLILIFPTIFPISLFYQIKQSQVASNQLSGSNSEMPQTEDRSVLFCFVVNDYSVRVKCRTEMSFYRQKCPFFCAQNRSVLFLIFRIQECPFPLYKNQIQLLWNQTRLSDN